MSHQILQIAKIKPYRRLVAAASGYSLAVWFEVLAVGWFIFESTDSILLTALTWSVRSLPNLLFGGFAGVIADRYPRHRVLSINAGLRALNVLLMAAVTRYLDGSAVLLLCLTALSGILTTIQRSSLLSLAGDLVAELDLGRAVSFLVLTQRIVGIGGAVGAGYLLETIGPGPVFALAALPVVLAAGLYVTMPSKPRAADGTSRFWEDFRSGVHSLRRTPVVVQLLSLAILSEIFGFACSSLMPVIVSDLLSEGADSLGVMSGTAGVGALAGVAALSFFPSRLINTRALLCCFSAFGLAIVALSQATSLPQGMGVIVVFGAAAAMIDTIQWSLLQANVEESLRGRVLGAWNVAIGMGWIGPLALGAVGEVLGVAAVLACSGAVVCLVGIFAFRSRTLRNARSVS
jgi:MFS family permease